MTSYTVYRPGKGNLTFKPTKEIAYTIKASTLNGAEKMLTMLKRAEDQLNKDNDDHVSAGYIG